MWGGERTSLETATSGKDVWGIDVPGSGAGDSGERCGGSEGGVSVEGRPEVCPTDVLCGASCRKGPRRPVGLSRRVSTFAESADVRGMEPEDSRSESDPSPSLLLTLSFIFLMRRISCKRMSRSVDREREIVGSQNDGRTPSMRGKDTQYMVH